MSPFRSLSVRLTVALLLVGGVFYSFIWRPESVIYPHIKSRPTSTIQLSDYLARHNLQPELHQNAHRLASANDFLPHFAAVVELPNITMAEGKAGCTWTKEDNINYQFGETLNEEGWVNASWTVRERQDWELQEPRYIWQNWVRHQMMPYDDYKDRFKGRGIVIVGGNGKTIPRIKIILRALNDLGSTIPVEMHYWGAEMTPEIQQELLSLYPRCLFNDLSAPSNVVHTAFVSLFINYQLKTAAVINSRFEEPLLLDSDNIPTIKPELLYESETYKEYGTVFWPDMSRTRPNNPVWAITNNVCTMDEWEQESGQMIVDKRKFFYHLQLAAWLNNEHGKYWNNFILGDKDMFRFSWKALKTPYGTPTKWLTSVGTNATKEGKPFFCGHTFAQHHPDTDQIAFLHGGTLKTVPKQVLQWGRDLGKGVFQAYKRYKYDEDKSRSAHFNGIPDGYDYIPASYRPVDRPAMCTDFEDIEARDFEEVMPGWEQKFEKYGGYWLLNEE